MSRRAFTLIELVMTMAIIGVFSLTGSYIMAHAVQAGIYLPNKLGADMLAQDALNILIDGDAQAKGLRFSRQITSLADNDITFINQDGYSIRYRWDPASNTICRTVGAGSQVKLVYYLSGAMSLSGSNNKIFSYYDSSGTATLNPADVRRVQLAVTAKTGTGAFSDWQGYAELTSAVAVPKYQ